MDNLEEYRSVVDHLLAERRTIKSRLKTERKSLIVVKERRQALLEAQTLCQAVATQIQTQAHKRIAELVTSCLAIFEEPYEFKIDFKRARGKTEAILRFERDGVFVDPLTASGGGVVDVAAFALRLACLVLRKPPLRRLLVLDEPAKHLSAEYRPKFRAILERLSEELNVQIILVTHDRRLRIGKVFEIG